MGVWDYFGIAWLLDKILARKRHSASGGAKLRDIPYREAENYALYDNIEDEIYGLRDELDDIYEDEEDYFDELDDF